MRFVLIISDYFNHLSLNSFIKSLYDAIINLERTLKFQFV